MSTKNANNISPSNFPAGDSPPNIGGKGRTKAWHALGRAPFAGSSGRPFVDPLILLVAAAGFGLMANYASPRGISLIPAPKPVLQANKYLGIDEATRLWRDGVAIFLDAREPMDYKAGHIGNAFNLPALSFAENYGEIAPMLSPNSPLVLYCDGEECDLSHRLAVSLRAQGHTNLHLLFNGWAAWRTAGLPIAKGNSH